MALEDLIIQGIAVVIMTMVASAYIRRSMERRLKTDQIKSMITQLGLKNFRAEDFNKLTDQGIANLVTFIAAWKQADNPFGMPGVNFDLNRFLPKQFQQTRDEQK